MTKTDSILSKMLKKSEKQGRRGGGGRGSTFEFMAFTLPFIPRSTGACDFFYFKGGESKGCFRT